MIKATNNAKGIELIREGDIIVFEGHFGKEGVVSTMVMTVVDAQSIFDNTGPIEMYLNGLYMGLIGYEPQGTIFIFLPNQGYDMISVNSDELKREVEKIAS